MKNRIELLQIKIQEEINVCAAARYPSDPQPNMVATLNLMLELAECTRNIERGVHNLVY
jgi:hypothetical protein